MPTFSARGFKSGPRITIAGIWAIKVPTARKIPAIMNNIMVGEEVIKPIESTKYFGILKKAKTQPYIDAAPTANREMEANFTVLRNSGGTSFGNILR